MRYDFEEFLKDFLYAPGSVRDALMEQFYHGPSAEKLRASVTPGAAEAIARATSMEPAMPIGSAKAHKDNALARIRELIPVSAGEICNHLHGRTLNSHLSHYDGMCPTFKFYVASEVDARLHEAESVIEELETRISKMRAWLQHETEEDACWDQGKRKE